MGGGRRSSPAHALAVSLPPRPNIDVRTVAGFGDEWARYDQSVLTESELRASFDAYFNVFPWDALAPDAVGFDAGCGSGRWARFAAARVGTLHCADASPKALAVARQALADVPNVHFVCAGIDAMPFEDGSMDFGYSLGVLHHVPDTAAGIASCVQKLKPGAPLLLYLYYALDGAPRWYRGLWKSSDRLRRVVSRLPATPRVVLTSLIAGMVYFPLARLARFAERHGMRVSSFPLAFYRHLSFYAMRTDALDRFGTRLEQRFTRSQVENLMRAAGLNDIVFSERPPYWCAVGHRAR